MRFTILIPSRGENVQYQMNECVTRDGTSRHGKKREKVTGRENNEREGAIERLLQAPNFSSRSK